MKENRRKKNIRTVPVVKKPFWIVLSFKSETWLSIDQPQTNPKWDG